MFVKGNWGIIKNPDAIWIVESEEEFLISAENSESKIFIISKHTTLQSARFELDSIYTRMFQGNGTIFQAGHGYEY